MNKSNDLPDKVVTNIIQMLHTTAAYQSAAFQLMVSEASFAAKQLDLKETTPISLTQSSNEWNISPPPWGVGGEVVTSNYVYSFQKGRLTFIQKRDWEERLSPATTNLLEWTRQTSLIDTNGAYQLATQWLGALSVDVAKLGQTDPAHTFQQRVPITPANQNGEETTERKPIPFFDVGWSQRPPPFSYFSGTVGVKILGTTKELLTLHVRDISLFKGPPLRVANVAELLGPLPPPRHFVEELLGGSNAFETVKSPDQVEAWLLNSFAEHRVPGKQPERSGPMKLKANVAKTFSNTLLDFNSYAWGSIKLCRPDYGLRLRFVRGNDSVEILFCYECDILQVTHNGRTKEENFDFAHNNLVKAVQSLFSKDEAIRKLELNDERQSRKEYEGMLIPQ